MKSFAACIVSIAAFSCSTIDKTPLHYGCPGPLGPKKDIKAGQTVLLIDVDESGKAENIRVAESEPKGMWDDAAKCVAKKGVFVNNEEGEGPPFKNHKVYFKARLVP